MSGGTRESQNCRPENPKPRFTSLGNRSNDERTAKRISDALGTATELRAQRNYAGHRLSPWLGHLMVSRQETARQLLTPGEVMQLPPDDEVVMVSGHPPVRAKKLRFYADSELQAAPSAGADPDGRRLRRQTRCPGRRLVGGFRPDCCRRGSACRRTDERGTRAGCAASPSSTSPCPQAQPAEEEHRPDLILLDDDDADLEVERARAMRAGERQLNRVARNAALDPDDGIAL